MSDPLGLSIGTTNLVAARVGNQPVTRRSVLTLANGMMLSGFVERVGDTVPMVAPDGSTHLADRLLVDALAPLVNASSGRSPADIAIAVPAHWGPRPLRALRAALLANPALAPNGMPARLISDAVASLTALQANPGLAPHGVVALWISVAAARASHWPTPRRRSSRSARPRDTRISPATRSIRRCSVTYSTASPAQATVDPATTAAVGSLARLREECRLAKERLSAESVTELVAELPGYRSGIRVTRAELEALIAGPLAGVLAALENALEHNRIGWQNISAVVTVGGGASIPLITQRLSEHSKAPVVTTPQPALDAAVGAALFAAYGSAAEAEAQTGVAPVAEAQTGSRPWRTCRSATFRALAWSQDDDSADEPVPYTGENPYDRRPTGDAPAGAVCAADRADRGSRAHGSGCRSWCSGSPRPSR